MSINKSINSQFRKLNILSGLNLSASLRALLIVFSVSFLQTGINADKQRALLRQRREKLTSKLKQAISRTLMPNYTEKVPDRVRQEMDNKVSILSNG